jgi:hypothetical protein
VNENIFQGLRFKVWDVGLRVQRGLTVEGGSSTFKGL